MDRLQEDIKSLEASAQACLEAANDQPQFYELCHDFTTSISEQLASAQSDQVLAYLRQTLFPVQPPARLIKVVQNISWDLFRLIIPFVENETDTSEIAQEIIRSIAELGRPREIYMASIEILTLLEWNGKEQQALQRVEVMSKVLMIERRSLLKFLPDAVKVYIRIWRRLKIVDPVLKDRMLSHLILVSEWFTSLFNFIDCKTDLTLSSAPSDDVNYEYYIATYYLIHATECYVDAYSIPMSEMYYKRFHPKYFRIPGKAKAGDSIRNEDKEHLEKLIRLAINNCVTTNQLLNYYVYHNNINEDVKDEDDQKGVKFSTTEICIPSDVILSFFACAIYCQTLLLSKIMLLPQTISPLWILKKLVPLVVNRLPNEEKERLVADRTLLVLIFLVERIEENSITNEYLDQELSGTDVQASILIKVIASFASTSSNESLRFIAFQLLSRIIAICTDDAKVFLLNELLNTCPFETMRCAAIGLVKDIVANSLERASQVRDGEKPYSSIFASTYMVETFFPRILRFDPPTVIRNDSDFMEKYSYIIHGLNFYLFVLMRDVQNLTGVWDDIQIRDTNKEFLNPLEKKVREWVKSFEETLKDMQQPDACSETSDVKLKLVQEYQALHDKVNNLYILENVLGKIRDVLKKGKA
ncbi:5454_t:CDS:10 [Paraglomus occultum]|uniref:5454_t:CDS:1 n=1 Tax=Paraglomus occultum TaxID=144539 RepID=A0A9N9BJ53_9GLOM|nr:5454_t:CDS:10 [Paraglomus occultum]